MSWFASSKKRRASPRQEALESSLAIVEFSLDGKIQSANETFCKISGYPEAELKGRPQAALVDPETARSPEYADLWRRLAAGESVTRVSRRVSRDGRAFYLQATYSPMLGSDGRVTGFLGAGLDITEAKAKALELEATMTALARAQAIVEFTPEGEVLAANDIFFSTLGYRRDEIVGKKHSLFVDPAYAASEAYREFWRKLRAGETIVDSFRRLAKGGRQIMLQASYSPVLDESGKVFKVVKFAYDISDVIALAEALTRLSDRDLRQRLDKPFVPAFEKLRVDFNQAAETLSATLSNVAGAADIVGMSADEIASASQDLSNRAESQAASLEQTAAALSEVTGTVQKTTSNARLANQVVGEAKGDAERSGEIVGRAVEAMGRIEHSSQEIGKIIGVIDEIAFQTNLLALNAGVEAARAGDAGRGFAVVASEVRALAQRSADAAKQIKALISASGADVAAGVKLVRQTGEALGAIVGKVMDINKLVGEIAAGAEEQSSALAEVNAAVGQMDQSTQQNAAMAEEANAAVGSMKQQMQNLNEALGGFKLTRPAQAEAPRRLRNAAA